MSLALLLIAGAQLLGVSAAGAQELTVQAPGMAPAHLLVADLERLPTEELTVQDEHGQSVRYRGARVAEVLSKAGATLPVLRGRAMTGTFLVTAADGYAVVFALPEIDAAFTSGDVFVCFERDGHPIDETEGPIRLVVPQDKRHARWVRRVTRLEIQPGAQHEN